MTRILDFSDGFDSNSAPSGTPPGTSIIVNEEGVPITATPHSELNFIGTAVTATDGGSGIANITIVSQIIVQDEGTPLGSTPHQTLNFVGANVTAVDGGGGVATITIPREITVQDESTPITATPHSTLNFLGSAIAAVNAGGGVANITITPDIILQDEGIAVTNTPHQTLNFVGAGITVADAGSGIATITVIDEIIIQDEGTPITATPHSTINLIGDNVVASNGGGGVANITIVESPAFNAGVVNVSANSTINAGFGVPDATGGIVAIKNGEIIGLSLTLNAARTAGTATLQSVINGVAQNAAGETIQINVTDTLTVAAILSSPVAYLAGDQIQLQTVTVGFTPVGADAACAMYMRDT